MWAEMADDDVDWQVFANLAGVLKDENAIPCTRVVVLRVMKQLASAKANHPPICNSLLTSVIDVVSSGSSHLGYKPGVQILASLFSNPKNTDALLPHRTALRDLRPPNPKHDLFASIIRLPITRIKLV